MVKVFCIRLFQYRDFLNDAVFGTEKPGGTSSLDTHGLGMGSALIDVSSEEGAA
jgi:hypothetical protein